MARKVRGRPSLRDEVATVCAVLAAIAWVGWYVAFGLPWDLNTVGGWFGLMSVTLAGAIMGWWIGEMAIRSFLQASQRLVRGMSRIRVETPLPVQAVRRELAIVRATAPREISHLLTAVDQSIAIVEERQKRETAWLAATVHDLRAPLLGWANLLSSHSATATRDIGTPPSAGIELDQVARDLRSQAVALQRILEVVRLERTELALNLRRLDLLELARDVVGRTLFRPDVVVHVGGRGSAHADGALIERVVANLVENAVRHARSSVDVAVFPNLVRVSDDGSGLEEPLERLTEPFRSATISQSLPVPVGVAGIGLSVVRRILELHGGGLVVERSDRSGTVLLAYLGAGTVDA